MFECSRILKKLRLSIRGAKAAITVLGGCASRLFTQSPKK